MNRLRLLTVSIVVSVLMGIGMALLGGMLLAAKKDLGKAIGDCNAEKAEAIAEAERITGSAVAAAAQKRINALEKRLQDERAATVQLELAKEEAELRARDARATIQRLTEAGQHENAPKGLACLSQCVPPDAIERVR